MNSIDLTQIHSFLIGIFGIAVASFLLLKRANDDNQYLNNLLAAHILLSSFHMFRNHLIATGWILEIPWLYGTFSFIYITAPAVTYLYIKGLLNDETQFSRKNLLHFIPGLLQLILCLPYIFSSHQNKVEIVRKVNNMNNYLNGVPFNGISPKFFFAEVFIIVLVYSYLCMMQLRRAKTKYSHNHNKSILRWAKWVTLILFLMAVLMLLNFVLSSQQINRSQLLVFFGPFYLGRQILFVAMLLVIVFSKSLRLGLPNFVYMQHVHPSLTTSQTPMDLTQTNNENHEQQMDGFRQILDGFFESEDARYTQKNFNLEQLSIATKIPKHHWAFYFRYHSETTFIDLRNKHRVKYAKTLMSLTKYREFTLESIGDTAGFGSRTTFFNAFKKHENMSPSDFLNRTN